MKQFRLPFLAKGGILVLGYVVVLLLIWSGVINDYIQATMVTICINIILASSLNLITGFTGQFSLGHAGFMSIGAYTTALVTMNFPTVWGFVGGLLLGAVIAAIIGLLIGLPTLRLSGDYLAIATLGMAEIIRVLMLNFEFTNGAAGLIGIPRMVDWNWLFVFTAGSVILIANLLRSAPGRNMIAVREDEIAATSIGVNALQAKTLAFVVGAFFGALAGGMYSTYFYVIKPDIFGFLKSVDILIIVVLGGLGSLSGSVIAAILLALISTILQDFSDLRMVIYGLILVVIMVFRPQGLLGDREITLSALGRIIPRLPRKRNEVQP
ncbi:MAG: branched-chain amino acid ABC transporter permease [Propionibacteriaceae bacterium]|nr:branched-chain amino acid ABC transporter permease [Propionibacteriaceae bacterium]